MIIPYFTRNFLNRNKYVNIYDYLAGTKLRAPMQKVIFTKHNHMAQWNLFDVVNSVILKFPADICNFPLLFSHSKNIRMSTLVAIIITYELLIIVIIIITKSHFNYCSVGVMELCLLPLFIRRDLGTSQSVCRKKKFSYHISYENIDQKHEILTFKFNTWIYVLFQSHIYNWYIDLFS